MAAEIGNQYAKGHGFGRPRVIPQTNDELIALGEDLVKWAQEDTINNITFPLFYTSRGIIRKEWKLIIQHDIFRPYYEKAQCLLGKNFINGNIQSSIAHRFVRLYHLDVKEDEDEIADKKNGAIAQSVEHLASVKKEIAKGDIRQE